MPSPALPNPGRGWDARRARRKGIGEEAGRRAVVPGASSPRRPTRATCAIAYTPPPATSCQTNIPRPAPSSASWRLYPAGLIPDQGQEGPAPAF